MSVRQVGDEWKYKDLFYQEDGWCSPNDGLPLPYDLLHLEVKKWWGKKVVPGWWDGKMWYSFKEGDMKTVLRWRRSEGKYERYERY